MQVFNKPDYSVDDASCKTNTGKTFAEWFAFLDEHDGLKIGRRESVQKVYSAIRGTDAWWPTTVYVQYEKHHGITKKDGLAEGYTICVTKSINAPVEKTYATWETAFSEVFGDGGKQVLEDGGSITDERGNKGTFNRVRPNKDLRFTWEHPGCTAPMTVDLQFQDNKGKTLMNAMTSRIQTRDEADGLRNAWAEVLTRLKAKAES